MKLNAWMTMMTANRPEQPFGNGSFAEGNFAT